MQTVPTLGYKDHVTEADLMLFGGSVPKGSGAKRGIIPYFRHEDENEIDQIVSQLSADTRTIIIARYIHNLPIEELAESAGISRITLWRKMSDIRETILKHLEW